MVPKAVPKSLGYAGLLLLNLGLTPLTLLASDADSAREAPFELLERMARALETTDFEGTFVHQYGNSLSAMRVAHRYRDGVSQESFLSLNGPLRTLGRSGSSVACLLSGGQSVQLNRGASAAVSAGPVAVRDWPRLVEYYRFAHGERTRVAARPVDVVNVMPRDDLRYGYRFSIDQETGLPLRTALLDAEGRPIQQIMFTELRLLTDGDANGLTRAVVTPDGRPAKADAVAQVGASSRWRFNALPAGFELRATQRIASGDAPIEHLLFSDGLAWVSLYIEQTDQPGLVGETQMAAIHAAGKWVDGYQLTAVGEVPGLTVSTLLDALDVQSPDFLRFDRSQQPTLTSPGSVAP